MSRFLSEKALFKCANNPEPPFFKAAANQSAVEINGQPVLTTRSTLSASAPKPCKQLFSATQGAQQFCTQIFSPWQGGIDILHTAKDLPLLTDEASCRCMQFGCSISFSGIDYGNRGEFFNGTMQSGQSKASQEQEKKQDDQDSPDAKQQEAASKEQAGDKDTRANGQAPQPSPPVSAAASEDRTEEEAARYFYACRDCSRADCRIDKSLIDKYRDVRLEDVDWDNLPLTVNNDSATLRRNYLGALDASEGSLADRVYLKSEEKLGSMPGAWKYQAHHLISGKQVFAGLPQLVRMARVCDYEINHRRNCIMLLANEDNYGELAKPTKHLSQPSAEEVKNEARASQAYDAMRAAGMQWHVGHHYYSFDEEEAAAIRAALPKTGNSLPELASYKEILERRMKTLEAALVKSPEKYGRVCPYDFIEGMNSFGASIRDKLAAFYHDRRASYPWYVSRHSYLFAYGLPLKFRVITMRVQKDAYLLEKFSICNAQQAAESVKPIGSPLYYSPQSDPDFVCVRFCSNVEHFLFFGNCGPAQLPFNFEKDKTEAIFCRHAWHGNYEPKKYLEHNQSEILAWVSRSMQDDYKSPVVRSRERMANLRKKQKEQA